LGNRLNLAVVRVMKEFKILWTFLKCHIVDMSVDGDLIQRHPIDSSFLFFVTGFLSLFSSWASKILLSGW
jgi:hypothetical protein